MQAGKENRAGRCARRWAVRMCYGGIGVRRIWLVLFLRRQRLDGEKINFHTKKWPFAKKILMEF